MYPLCIACVVLFADLQGLRVLQQNIIAQAQAQAAHYHMVQAAHHHSVVTCKALRAETSGWCVRSGL